MAKVAIDPGHRKDTPGKRYADFLEYEFNDDIAKRLKKHLEHNGFQTLLTIETETHPYSETTSAGQSKNLQVRASRANDWGADLFVSVHANAHGDTKAQGYESFIYSPGGEKERLARLIENRAKEYLPELKFRGIKTANFAVLRRTVMPAVLVEHGFFTNDHDRALLKTDEFRERCALHLAAGICDYFGKPFEGEKMNPVREFQAKYNLAADGIIGPETRGKAEEVIRGLVNPIKAFQAEYGLVVDGIIGQQTISKILDIVGRENPVKHKYQKIAETHVVEIEPLSLRAKRTQHNSRIIARTHKNFIGSNFFESGNKIIGWLISEGKILAQRNEHIEFPGWKGNPKGTLIVYRDGRVEVGWKWDSEIEPDDIWFCCQGFNLYPPKMTLREGMKKEGFDYATVGYSTNRLSIGYNPDTKKIVVAARPNSNAERAVITMGNLGCEYNAICLDSGLSCVFVVDSIEHMTTSRILPSIITWEG